MLLKYQASPFLAKPRPPFSAGDHVLFEDDQGYLVNGRFTGPHTLYKERVDASGWPWTLLNSSRTLCMEPIRRRPD